MELSFPWASTQSKALDAALARASTKQLPALWGDRYRLEGRLPSDFKRLSMRNADRFRIEVGRQGQVFGLMELDEHSSGGFGGSCIPVNALVALLNLWTSQQEPAPEVLRAPIQCELF